jgi:putative CocE/NonD family hydrolase
MRDSIEHPLRDEYWDDFDLVQNIDKVECPNLIVSGWYDIFLDQALRYTGQIRQNSANEQARRQQHIIIGPWGHLINETPEGREFGPTAAKNVNELTVQWFAHWLNGEDNGVNKLPYLQLFVMGANHWREADDWPLPETEWTKYYLHSCGSANTAAGNGSLNVYEPECEPPDKFIYDPENPVPTIGGEWRFYDKWGPQDQSEVEARDDVLVYTSAVLEDPLEVTGPIQVVLYAATDASDTDWTAKLVDVNPDGKALNLCDGIIRARYRNPKKGAQSLEAGKVYRYEINLWATSNEFQPGHRIRLQISSSSFPRFDCNPNTGKPFGLTRDLKRAQQKVLHNGEHVSHILLPVIPK